MRYTPLLATLFFFLILSCKKTIVNPTTTIVNDTTIIIHTDTTIIINYDTTIQQGDKQIRFSLPGTSTYDTAYLFTDSLVNIQKFNIDYFPGVDSVFYSINSAVENGNTGTIELYNFTDNQPIAGSLVNVVRTTNEGVFYHSGNIIAALPHKEIILGLRVKSAFPNKFMNAVFGYLYLYRK